MKDKIKITKSHFETILNRRLVPYIIFLELKREYFKALIGSGTWLRKYDPIAFKHKYNEYTAIKINNFKGE